MTKFLSVNELQLLSPSQLRKIAANIQAAHRAGTTKTSAPDWMVVQTENRVFRKDQMYCARLPPDSRAVIVTTSGIIFHVEDGYHNLSDAEFTYMRSWLEILCPGVVDMDALTVGRPRWAQVMSKHRPSFDPHVLLVLTHYILVGPQNV